MPPTTLRRLRPAEPTPAISSSGAGSGDLVGVVNSVSEIVGGAFRSGYLGYYAFAPRGTRSDARGLALVIAHAFRRLRPAPRLEANIQPGQLGRRSASSGGVSASAAKAIPRRYLKIAGALARPRALGDPSRGRSSAQRPSAVIR